MQLTSSSKYPRKLKGQRTRAAVAVTLDDETVAKSQGEVLFTDYGLSGIAVMDVSWAVGQNFARPRPQKCCAVLDLVPEWSENQLLSYLRQFGSLRGILSAEVTAILEKQAAGDPARLVQIAKHWQLIVTGTKATPLPRSPAAVCPGGIGGLCLSAGARAVYCRRGAGRAAACGGYNLNFAFYSGLAAAGQMVEKRNDTSK